MGNTSSSGGGQRGSGKSVISEDENALAVLYEKLCVDGHFDRTLFQKFLCDGCPVKDLPAIIVNMVCEHHASIHQKDFITAMHPLLDNVYKTQEFQVNYYMNLLLGGKQDVNKADVLWLVSICCEFGVSISDLNDGLQIQDTDSFLNSLTGFCLQGQDTRMRSYVSVWFVEHQLPIFAGLNSWLHVKLTGASHRSLFHMLPLPPDHRGRLLSPSLLWYFCTVLPPCYIRLDKKEHFDANGDVLHTDDMSAFTWNLLYDSDDHGLSINRLKNKCLNYKSPTVALIKFKSGIVVAAALDNQWIESPDNFGGAYCQLIEVYPNYSIISAGSDLFYLKQHGRSIATGLHLGEGKPAKIEIDADLNNARMIYKDHGHDNVIRIEIWGCGGISAALQQQNQKQWEAKETEKRKKVKRPGDWQDNPDRTLLELGGVRVSHSEKHE